MTFLEPASVPVPLGANAGIRTGTRVLLDGEEGYVTVIDLDVKPICEKYPHGVNAIGPFLARFGHVAGLADMVTVSTPGGGAHLYAVTRARIPNAQGALGIPGVDVRGSNGYLVAPGSVGYVYKDLRAELGVRPYTWVSGTKLGWMPAELEAALLAERKGISGVLSSGGVMPALTEGSAHVPTEWLATEDSEEGVNALARALKRISEAATGTRNDTLFRECVKLGDFGMMGTLTIASARRAVYHCVHTWDDPDKTVATIERAFARAKAVKIIVIRPNHMAMNEEAIPALVTHPSLYVIGDKLAIEGAPTVDGEPRIRAMNSSGLGELLSSVCSYRQMKDGEPVPVHVPTYTPLEIMARGTWTDARTVVGYSLVPVLRPDGTIVREGGYDKTTHLYLAKSVDTALPSWRDALELLRYLAKDFPFSEPCDFTAWLSACCTPLAMYSYRGATPLHLVEASRKNSGKSFLASAAMLVGTGKLQQEAGWPQNNETELTKKLLTWALELNKPAVFYDNVDGEFSSAVLAGFLTSQNRIVSDRVLGGSSSFTGVLNTTFIVTANNPVIGTDLERRIVPCRLAPSDDPYSSRAFDIPDFLGFVREHRELLTRCCLSLLLEGRARIMRGERPKVVPAHSFDAWARAVRDPLVSLGLADPWTGVERLGGESEELAHDAALAVATALVGARTAGQRGLSSRQFLALCDFGAPPNAFQRFMKERTGGRNLTSRAVSYVLRSVKDVWVHVPSIGKIKVTSERANNHENRTWIAVHADGTLA